MNNIENTVNLLWDKVRNLENEILQVRDGTLGWTTNVKARIYLSAVQSIPSGAWTVVQLNKVDYNPGGYFNTSLYRFIAPISGYYAFNYQVFWVATTVGDAYGQLLRKNGNT